MHMFMCVDGATKGADGIMNVVAISLQPATHTHTHTQHPSLSFSPTPCIIVSMTVKQGVRL